MVLLSQESRLLTGSADSELRAWDINYLEEVRKDSAEHFFFSSSPNCPLLKKDNQRESKQFFLRSWSLSPNVRCFTFYEDVMFCF